MLVNGVAPEGYEEGVEEVLHEMRLHPCHMSLEVPYDKAQERKVLDWVERLERAYKRERGRGARKEYRVMVVFGEDGLWTELKPYDGMGTDDETFESKEDAYRVLEEYLGNVRGECGEEYERRYGYVVQERERREWSDLEERKPRSREG